MKTACFDMPFFLFEGVHFVESFHFEIAGSVFSVQPLFQSTKEYCKPYLTDKEPEFLVSVRNDDLAFEQALLEQEAVEQGLKIRKFKEPFLERSVIQRQVADFLVSRNTLMLHGSTVSVDGQAYLFTAPCGTGKSTHTEKWIRLFGAHYLNDDKPIIRLVDGKWIAYGTPWSGKHDLSRPEKAPLGAVAFLQRGTENSICRLEPQEAIPYYVSQLLRAISGELMQQQLTLLDRLLQDVPAYLLTCRNDDEAAFTAKAAMEVLNGND